MSQNASDQARETVDAVYRTDSRRVLASFDASRTELVAPFGADTAALNNKCCQDLP